MAIPSKNIVILGGGFCGLQTAKTLGQLLGKTKEYHIILVSRKNVHVYHADLYEISTTFHSRITAACMRLLSKTVCLGLRKALKGLPVTIVEDEIEGIDVQQKTVSLKKTGSLPYEYMAVTLGAVTNYYGIPGLEEHSLPLKTLQDALALNCDVDQFFKQRWEEKKHGKVSLVVGGGGATGVEYACELIGYIKKLSEKYDFALSEISMNLIQGANELICVGQKVSDIAMKRLHKLGIKVMLNSYIKSYDGKYVEISTKDHGNTKLQADLLIWTGGIKPNPLLKNFPILHANGALEVFPTLECNHYQKIYAGGDNAAMYDPKSGQLVAKIAANAIQSGQIIGYNIWADITQQPKKTFQPKEKGFYVALGGRYFVYKKGRHVLKGFLPFLMRRWHDFRYFSSLMSAKDAWLKILRNENIFEKNDEPDAHLELS